MNVPRTWELRVFIVIAGLLSPVAIVADDGESLDRDLLEALEGDPQADSLDRIIPRLIDGTKTAAQQIEQGQLSDETVSLQAQILADLDALLAQSSPPNQPPPGGASSSQSQDQQKQQASQSQQSSEESSGSQQDGQSDPNAAAKESAERSAQGENEIGERERRLGLSTAAWGHLPPKVREQMRSAFSEEYLPEYDALVRRYYEALARKRESRR